MQRSAGVLLHPSSLPSPYGIGDLGAGARAFVDWLAEARIGVWQVLPLVPPDPSGSPYASASSLATNPQLVDPVGLFEHGLLDGADLSAPPTPLDRCDFERVREIKGTLVQRAAIRLRNAKAHPWRKALARFRAEEDWVEDAALFLAVKAQHGGAPWWEWEPALRDREPAALAAARRELDEPIDEAISAWFFFEQQWHALKEYANERDVRVLGDVPIYVARDSVDVWASRDQFRLDAEGQPLAVAGVPPDYFSETGQLWGNPLYDWERMAADGYAWWVHRLRRTLRQFDVVRIDHFRAFASFWEVPPDAVDARPGRWVEGPGEAFFEAMRAALGDLPIVAEDLGDIDQPVHDLRDAVGLPGMAVLQFAFGQDAEHPFLPHNLVPSRVLYTGTHDNDTTRGFWNSAPEPVRDHIRRYLGRSGEDVVWDLIRAAFASVAELAIVPLQDVLDLDSGARMNTPGVGDGNWAWRVRIDAFNEHVAARLRDLAELYGRASAPPD